MLSSICIIGAGNIGSRHLQALATITQPLSIYVIDPSAESLKTAKIRYEETAKVKSPHKTSFLQNLEDINFPINIAIIATNSNIRSLVTKKLLDSSSVKYIIFEKILFDKFDQYEEMQKLLMVKGCKAWVNCSRRTMPFYTGLKQEIKDQKIQYIVSGSNWGLASNTIHLIDHIAFLTDCYDFEIDTIHLDPVPVKSKRQGFLELTGTLTVNFKNGSIGLFTSYPNGNAPQIMQIFSEKFRCLTIETEGKSYISKDNLNWKWNIKNTPMLLQSEMTNSVVASLLSSGSCDLTPFNLSIKLHLALFEPMLSFLNKYTHKKYQNYPFT